MFGCCYPSPLVCSREDQTQVHWYVLEFRPWTFPDHTGETKVLWTTQGIILRICQKKVLCFQNKLGNFSFYAKEILFCFIHLFACWFEAQAVLNNYNCFYFDYDNLLISFYKLTILADYEDMVCIQIWGGKKITRENIYYDNEQEKKKGATKGMKTDYRTLTSHSSVLRREEIRGLFSDVLYFQFIKLCFQMWEQKTIITSSQRTMAVR